MHGVALIWVIFSRRMEEVWKAYSSRTESFWPSGISTSATRTRERRYRQCGGIVGEVGTYSPENGLEPIKT